MITLPIGAENNIPPEWKAWDNDRSIGFVFPSVSGDEPHTIKLSRQTRELSCDCRGFWFKKGECRHVKLASASLYKKAKRRPMKGQGIQPTSVLSFHMFSSDDLGNRQQEVLTALEDNGPMSNKQVAKVLNKPINVITPRMKELRVIGFVEDAGTQWDPITHRFEKVWKAIE